jgi:hypothetical protein
MRKLINGFLIGFGSALSIILFASWILLLRVLESGYLIVAEAKVIEAAQIATNAGTIFGILLVIAGLGLELLGKKRDSNPTRGKAKSFRL